MIMKRLLLPTALFACLLFSACNTTQKLYEAEEYDQVILRTAPKICAGRIHADEVTWVANAYHKANQADHERIQQLKATGQPDVWPEIYERYTSMKGREDALSCFPNQLKKEIHYQPLNLDDELSGSKNKAEAYLSARIRQLLETGEPANIKEAKRLTRTLTRVSTDASLINEYQVMAMLRQTSHLESEFDYNDSRRPLPQGLDEAIMYFDETEISHFPIAKDSLMKTAKMIVELTDFIVTPDRDETASFKESNGDLTAMVTDHNLSKSATVKADLHFIFKDPESVTGSDWNVITIHGLEASSKFNYSYTSIEGKAEACSAQTLERLAKQPLPFPTDVSLLRDAALKLNNLIAEQLSK
jgi:hypothetical protein